MNLFTAPAMLLAATLISCAPASRPAPAQSAVPHPPANTAAADAPDSTAAFAAAIVAEADRLALGELWPGFDSARIPVAVYTGENTFLFRHPSPPDGFVEVPGSPAMWRYPRRHPAVTANTSIELNGARTATILADPEERSMAASAGLLLHELFHVHQRANHPGWQANEASLFTYPVSTIEPLVLRRLETDALRRALAADEEARVRCWAKSALSIRSRRFAALPPEAVAYERKTELWEGLARYIQHQAVSERGESVLLADGFGPSDVRERGYATGLAFALLLDELSPGWRRALSRREDLSLDELLAQVPSPRGSSACEFSREERADARAAAESDVRALGARRQEELRAFQQREGWRIVVQAAHAPLFPQGFDPLNVDVVDAGKVLHGRLLQLGNGAATIEILGRAALTVAAGEHPLFDGVRTVVVTGLPEQPTITRAGATTTIQGAGVRIELKGGRVERSGSAIEVQLEPQADRAGGPEAHDQQRG